MERIEITTGDFLKNAGLVGLYYALKLAEAKKEEDFGLESQCLWISKAYAEVLDWTELYFRAFVHYMGTSTVYQVVLDKLQAGREKLAFNIWKGDKIEKEELKFINDKLLSNSYQSGFENIKDRIEHPEIYERLKKEKLTDKIEFAELKQRMTELEEFLLQPLCKETFGMKSIIYNYMNRFWDGKCFLLKSNAKKDMREVFENEFSTPLKYFISASHEKAKELCIDCGQLMTPKERVSIAFMNGKGDDFTRKRSSFWNCNADAFLCPLCAFVYAFSPLGFQQIGNKFSFMNLNHNMDMLLEVNKKEENIVYKAQREEGERYSTWASRLMNLTLEKKTKEIGSVQVIIRSTDASEDFEFHVIARDILRIFYDKRVRTYFDRLAEHPVVKRGKDYVNIHEAAVMNVLRYKNQYADLNQLLKQSIESEYMLFPAYYLCCIQIRINEIRNQKQGGEESMVPLSMVKSGYMLRKELLQRKNREGAGDECLRGTVYQLLNALSVKNTHKFLDIVVRLYSSCQMAIPDGFVWMLQDEEKFMDNGYSFVLGLKGSYREKEKNYA